MKDSISFMDLPTLVIFGGFTLEDEGGGGGREGEEGRGGGGRGGGGGGGEGGGGGGVEPNKLWEPEGLLFYSLGHEGEWRRVAVNEAATDKKESSSSSSLSTPRALHAMFVHQSKAQGRCLVVFGGQHSGMVCVCVCVCVCVFVCVCVCVRVFVCVCI
jgi:hypothetical protein